MSELLHLTEAATWDIARQTGEHRSSSRGITLEQEGFIHCALPHQLRGVAERYYSDVTDDLVLLVIDDTRLMAPVRFEPPAPGVDDDYPHVYGPVPVDAVIEVVPVTRDATGRFDFAGRA